MTYKFNANELYDEKWFKLNEALKAHEIAIRTPLLLSLNKYDEGNSEKWYTDADLKVMIFGQEVNRWELPADKRPIPADIMELYQEFYNENYKEVDGNIYFSISALMVLRAPFPSFYAKSFPLKELHFFGTTSPRLLLWVVMGQVYL